MEPLTWSLIGTVALAGFRHGFDIDHLAAIADISSSSPGRRKALWLSTLYATGHAAVLLVLGSVAVVAGERIPSGLDALMSRLIGITLLVLGGYVVYSVARYGRAARLRGRWTLILAGIQRTASWLRKDEPRAIEIEHAHEHDHVDPDHTHPHEALSERSVVTKHVHTHRHVIVQPIDPFGEYGARTALVVGMVHGVGAETPTQVLLLATAAGLAGGTSALILLATFVGGLFVANTAVALGAAIGFAEGRRLPTIYVVLAFLTALVSVWVGLAYVLDAPQILPPGLAP